MFQKLGPAFLQYLQVTFLPSVGLAPQANTEYLQALQASDAKAFTKYFKVCCCPTLPFSARLKLTHVSSF